MERVGSVAGDSESRAVTLLDEARDIAESLHFAAQTKGDLGCEGIYVKLDAKLLELRKHLIEHRCSIPRE